VGQQQLVTGSARMDTFRQTGDSLAGRFLAWRLHPISVKEWCEHSPDAAAGNPPTPDAALAHLLNRGGFPEPCLFPASTAGDNNAQRWRAQYADGLVREDVLEFSRIQEVGGMKVLLELLRERVGSPLSLASIGRDLGLSQPTVKRFIDILQALYIVFTVQPWHHNIARALLQSPKVYFFDTGMVGENTTPGTTSGPLDNAPQGLRFENAVATMLLKHVEFLQDSTAAPVGLHYIRTKDGAEIDFALSQGKALTHLIECKWADNTPHRAFAGFMPMWPEAQAVQLVRHLRNPELRNGVNVVPAASWLAGLDA
jgi:predicted AAA+ superfamily ATPase